MVYVQSSHSLYYLSIYLFFSCCFCCRAFFFLETYHSEGAGEAWGWLGAICFKLTALTGESITYSYPYFLAFLSFSLTSSFSYSYPYILSSSSCSFSLVSLCLHASTLYAFLKGIVLELMHLFLFVLFVCFVCLLQKSWRWLLGGIPPSLFGMQCTP